MNVVIGLVGKFGAHVSGVLRFFNQRVMIENQDLAVAIVLDSFLEAFLAALVSSTR